MLLIGGLSLLIIVGSLAYRFLSGKESAPSQSGTVTQVTPTPRPVGTPVAITQDVKNPALKGLAAEKSQNTLTVTVFLDSNGNGKKDEGENNFTESVEVAYGVPGKTSNAHTGNSGQVIFNKVDNGTFTVYMFNPPQAYTPTTPVIVKGVKIPPSATIDFGLKPNNQ